MIFDYLGTIWIIFLISWFFLLIIRTRLNYVIRKRQQLQSTSPGRVQSNSTLFFLSIFTLYNRPSKFDERSFRLLKIRTNLLHLLFVYGILFMPVLSFIGFIQYDISRNENEKNYMSHQRQTNCLGDKEARFGQDYNQERSKKNLIPVPEDFCMSTSDEKTEIYEPRNIPDQKYFHQAKYVYIEDGKWKGEYDIFVHREDNKQDETLTAEFTDLDGTIDVLYLYNDMGVSESKFVEMMQEWGLENELWWQPSN